MIFSISFDVSFQLSVIKTLQNYCYQTRFGAEDGTYNVFSVGIPAPQTA